MLGIGKHIQGIFNEQVVYKPFHTRKHGDIHRKGDIIRMIKNCNQCLTLKANQEELSRGLKHGVRFPKKCKERLLRHLKNMARVQELQEDLRK